MIPVATIGMSHVCPMVTGAVPHVGGPVAMGTPNVTVSGMPIALVGSTCVCSGPTDVIAVGSPMVTVAGMPAAIIGSMTAHGGTIAAGMPAFLA